MLGALAMPPAIAVAQIFECIDADGNIEFAQKCAPGTVKKREVANTAPGSSGGDAAPPQKSYQEEEAAFRRRQLERKQAEDNEAKAKAAAENAVKKCKAARARLVTTENARRLSGGIDPQTGQTRYLDDTERVAATQKARDAVTALCKQ